MTRLTFDLDTVCQLAEHAAAAATGTDHAGRPGPALLLHSGSNGIWLTSNAPTARPHRPTSPAPWTAAPRSRSSARPAPRGWSRSGCCAPKRPR
jgi:hypothetical protein